MKLIDLIPDGNVLLALPAEELAVAVLQTLKAEEKNERARREALADNGGEVKLSMGAHAHIIAEPAS